MTNDLSPIFALWDSLSDFAADAGVTYGAAKQMKRRNSIPVLYWQALIEGASRRGKDLTAERLLALHAGSSEHAA